MRRALIAFTTLFALLIAFVPTQTAAAMTMSVRKMKRARSIRPFVEKYAA